MKILVPVAADYGLDSAVFGHFGSAPCFLLIDGKGSILEAIDNPSSDHLHGHCSPLEHISRRSVDAIVVGGIGRRALAALLGKGIQVYASNDGTVEDALQRLNSGQLEAITELSSCSGQGDRGGCH